MKKTQAIILPLSLVFLLSSCFGLNMDIALNQNGSGTVTLEYRVAKSLDALGRLDGNERWNTIPVGRADFMRTLDRLPEMKLLSFSAREDEKNIISSAKMEFQSIQGLMAFLDATGQSSSFSGDARSGSMKFTLSEGSSLDETSSLNKLLAGICEGYSVKVSMTVPSQGTKAVFVADKDGTPYSGEGEISYSGNTHSCYLPLYSILSSRNGLNVEFRW